MVCKGTGKPEFRLASGPLNDDSFKMIFAVVLFAAAVLWRVLLGVSNIHNFGWMHNFAPLSAVALCGAAFLPRRTAVVLPLFALLLSDLAINAVYGVPMLSWEMLARYVALGGIVVLGLVLRKSPTFGRMLGASFAGSIGFYLITNSASWLTEAGYAKTLSGWVQALTMGLPGYPSTLSFYRSTLISDLLFTALFVVCLRSAATATATASRPVEAESAARA